VASNPPSGKPRPRRQKQLSRQAPRLIDNNPALLNRRKSKSARRKDKSSDRANRPQWPLLPRFNPLFADDVRLEYNRRAMKEKTTTKSGRGRILKMRLGVNPNSSSIGTDIIYLVLGSTSVLILTVWLATAVRLFRRRKADEKA
jgi:hypothetical protein